MLQIGHLLAAKALPVVDCAAVWATTCFSCAIHGVGWHSNVGSIHLRPKQTATRPEALPQLVRSAAATVQLSSATSQAHPAQVSQPNGSARLHATRKGSRYAAGASQVAGA